jgi:hypothetical protein
VGSTPTSATRGRNSTVECHPSKVAVAGSNPVVRFHATRTTKVFAAWSRCPVPYEPVAKEKFTMTTAERITAARIAALTRTVRELQAQVDALRAGAGLPPLPPSSAPADLRGERVYTK